MELKSVVLEIEVKKIFVRYRDLDRGLKIGRLTKRYENVCSISHLLIVL